MRPLSAKNKKYSLFQISVAYFSGAIIMDEWSYYLKFFISLVAIVNPPGIIPIFIDATRGMNKDERRQTGDLASFTVFMVLTISLLSGDAIIRFFGISIASFRVAGGILLLLASISMLQAKLSPEKQSQEEALDLESRKSLAVVPLGIPLLAGPGAISTVILHAQKHLTLMHYLGLFLVIMVLTALVWWLLRISAIIAGRLGKTGINLITRIMGLIMAAIGVEFMASGIKQFFPGLG